MKHKKKTKRYGAGGSSNPLRDLNNMQFARKGVAVGSLLEGCKIKYASGGPGPVSKGKEQFDKIQQYANNVSLYEKMSPYGLKKLYKNPVKRGEMSQDKLDQIIEVNKMNLPWDKFKRSRR